MQPATCTPLRLATSLGKVTVTGIGALTIFVMTTLLYSSITQRAIGLVGDTAPLPTANMLLIAMLCGSEMASAYSARFTGGGSEARNHKALYSMKQTQKYTGQLKQIVALRRTRVGYRSKRLNFQLFLQDIHMQKLSRELRIWG